jgi:DNA-binding protein YbaB
MFDQLKQLAKLKEMQSQMAAQRMIGEANGVSITLDGTMNIIDIKLNPSLDTAAQEKAVKAAFADAQHKLKSSLMKSMPGLLG